MSDQQPTRNLVALPFVLTAGRGAASGQREYQELGGSIALQKPLFKARGLDLEGFYNGTLNADISPRKARLVRPYLTLENVKWHPRMPAETFSFSPAVVSIGEYTAQALIYHPHADTKGPYGKPTPETLLEILAPPLMGIYYGQAGSLQVDPVELSIGD